LSTPELLRASELIIWNVGQGQWISEVHPELCLHYDMGGEKSPGLAITRLCRKKKNFILVSHWDWDHISWIASYSSQVDFACLLPPPKPPKSKRKKKSLESVKYCQTKELRAIEAFIEVIYRPPESGDANAASQVFYSKTFKTLIPGDSPRRAEEIWASQAPRSSEGFILGHHGSKTSTSLSLIRALPNLKWSIASARKSRYGHPHPETESLLKKEKVPLLRTEDWGHLHFLKNDKN